MDLSAVPPEWIAKIADVLLTKAIEEAPGKLRRPAL